MRSFVVVATALVVAVAQVSAAHVPHVPHRARHIEVARDLGEGSNATFVARAPSGLKRRQRCPAQTPTSGLTSSQVSSTSAAPSRPASRPENTETKHQSSSSSSSSAALPSSRPSSPPSSSSSSPSASTPPKPTTKTTQTGQNQTSTSTRPPQDGGSAPTKTQGGAAPTATRASASDPYLKSLSEPLNYAAHPYFNEPKHGDVTFYAQGQTACGDVYDDRTLTAAISQFAYDAWPGDCSATNRCPVCGPYTTGRYFLSSSNEVVPGSSHIVLGGDGLPNCFAGEQCHRPLTATITNPRNGAKVTVAVVDRCVGCKTGDIDCSPAAFLKLTRPDLDLSKIPTAQLMIEALKDHYGRIQMDWKFDSHQSFGPVRSV